MFNKVILIGNVGRDPEIRVLESGVKMARFTLATNEVYYTRDALRAVHTEWHNIVAWRADACYVEANVSVGTELYVEGRIRSRQAVDPRTKVSSTLYEIVATSIRLNSSATVTPDKDSQAESIEIESFVDPDGIPF